MRLINNVPDFKFHMNLPIKTLTLQYTLPIKWSPKFSQTLSSSIGPYCVVRYEMVYSIRV